ncbi:MAG: hypothetical protein FJ403_22715 [Verrucomicrobia bacterium]|nr:hypothetical protein [Verrucomicrobiota bacterium]
MHLDNLLNAAVELEKRIATDQMLRRYFSTVWGKDSAPTTVKSKLASPESKPSPETRDLTCTFPVKMCELLLLAANATGKTPTELLEESFAEYCAKHSAKWTANRE